MFMSLILSCSFRDDCIYYTNHLNHNFGYTCILGGGLGAVVESYLLRKSEITGSSPSLAFEFQKNKMFLPRSLVTGIVFINICQHLKLEISASNEWKRQRNNSCRITWIRVKKIFKDTSKIYLSTMISSTCSNSHDRVSIINLIIGN